MAEFFSYCPRSGSRIIKQKVTSTMCAFTFYNNSVLLAGEIAVLKYNAANPGKYYWRNDANRAAGEIISAVGGLAEDANGVISLAVPLRVALQVNEMMKQLRPRDMAGTLEDADNDARLWQAGRLEIAATYDELFFISKIVVPEPTSCLSIVGGSYCLLAGSPLASGSKKFLGAAKVSKVDGYGVTVPYDDNWKRLSYSPNRKIKFVGNADANTADANTADAGKETHASN